MTLLPPHRRRTEYVEHFEHLPRNWKHHFFADSGTVLEHAEVEISAPAYRGWRPTFPNVRPVGNANAAGL